MYILRQYSAKGEYLHWDYFITKVNLSAKTIKNISHISYYHNSVSDPFMQNYTNSGIQNPTMDVNNNDTHLFVAGDTRMDFTYQSTNTNITNSGGLDGILVCYDPQQTDTTANIRWMVNLRSAGEERFTDCKFDETTQTLHTVGFISPTPVDFNPNGSSMIRNSSAGNAMFYAVYDMDDGTCKSVQIMDASGNEIAHKISFTDNNSNVVLFGNFTGSPFQVDPSGRLSPLRTTDPANVIAKFSFSPTELPDPRHAVSYGSADNVKSSYGAASHEVMSCLKLGALNNPIEHTLEYQPKHTAGAVGANPNHDGLQSITFPSSGGMRITVNASNTKNSPADLAAWADFNNNGKFDPGEISSIVTLAPNVGTVSPDLAWSAFPVITKAKQNNVPLRIRLTSEPLDGSWGEGDAADGEVEDYLFDLDLIDVTKTVTPAAAKVGDTLNYKISIQNKSTAPLNLTSVVDPIPEYTAYVAGSATPVGATTGNINLGGATVNALQWPGATIGVGQTEYYAFRAVVTDAPQLHTPYDSIIANVGYVVLNGDSIPSTGQDCNRAEVEIIVLEAANDTTSAGACLDASVTIDVLANDLFICAESNLIMTVLTPPNQGSAAFTSDNKLEYTLQPGFVGLDSVEYQINCNGRTSSAWAFINIISDNDIFADDVWYFGRDVTSSKSLGIVFRKDAMGEYHPYDASGISKVNTQEQSLTVSNPYCEGQSIFYSQHNQLFNNQHTNMLNGTIQGHESCADGLAACYMGDNKYLLFSVSGFYSDPTRGLNAYVIDMNAENGLGAKLTSPVLEVEAPNSGMSESIELVPRAGTSTEYWLIYRYSGELRCRLVDVSNPSAPGINSYFSYISIPNDHTYVLTSSPNGDKLAITSYSTNATHVIDFNNNDGSLSNVRTITGTNYAYGAAFSPNGKYLYVAGWSTATSRLHQYDISGSTPTQVGTPVQYWEQTTDLSFKGGGLKLGPDGKIYVAQAHSDYVGVISDPDSNTALNGRYDIQGFRLSLQGGQYLEFSTGLTRPSILMCNTNQAPVAVADSAIVCPGAGVNVLRNDSDPDGHDIYLVNARFVNPADDALATITVIPADSTISVVLKPGVSVPFDYRFIIEYHIKDNGAPASACAMDGQLKLTLRQAVRYPDVRLQLCTGMTDPIRLSAYLDTVYFTSVVWSKISAGSPNFVGSTSTTTGELNPADFALGTHIYKYNIATICGTGEGRVYIKRTANPVVPSLRDTIVICRSIPSAAYMQLNQMLGLEAEGAWNYPQPALTPYTTAVGAPSQFAGAYIFNAAAAWQAVQIGTLPASYRITYNGDAQAAVFTFSYTTDAQTCFGNKTRELVLVVTSRILPLH